MEWLARHAPKTVAQMVGPRNTPDALLKWLKEWKRDGRHKAVLVTGPPGCGKTLLARVACSDAGVGRVLELNCSTKRTKKTVAELKDAFLVRPILSFLPNSRLSVHPGAIIIDEIDACDQGGLSELFACIKKSVVPVICIAGDAYCKPLKPLVDSALHLRMLRPSADQIAARLQMVAHHEGVSTQLSQAAAKSLASASNCDMRHAIIELYMATRGGTSMSLARNADGLLCDKALGLFDMIPRLFPREGPQQATPALCERIYMSDRSMVPLLVAENYLRTAPVQSDLDRMAAAAEEVSNGDTVAGVIYRSMAWELSDIHAFASTAAPCAAAGGPMAVKAEFPTVLAHITATASTQRRLVDMSKRYKVLPRIGTDSMAAEIIPGLFRRYVNTCRTPEISAAIAREMAGLGLDMDDWELICASSREKAPANPKARAALSAAFKKHAAARDVLSDDGDEVSEKPAKRSRK